MLNKFSYGLQVTLQHNLQKLEQLDGVAFDFEKFYGLCQEICELEALTFLKEENKTRLELCYVKLKKCAYELNTFIKEDISLERWRFTIGLFCCFMEWCENTGYFNLSKSQQEFIWSENPLAAILPTKNTKIT